MSGSEATVNSESWQNVSENPLNLTSLTAGQSAASWKNNPLKGKGRDKHTNVLEGLNKGCYLTRLFLFLKSFWIIPHILHSDCPPHVYYCSHGCEGHLTLTNTRLLRLTESFPERHYWFVWCVAVRVASNQWRPTGKQTHSNKLHTDCVVGNISTQGLRVLRTQDLWSHICFW